MASTEEAPLIDNPAGRGGRSISLSAAAEADTVRFRWPLPCAAAAPRKEISLRALRGGSVVDAEAVGTGVGGADRAGFASEGENFEPFWTLAIPPIFRPPTGAGTGMTGD